MIKIKVFKMSVGYRQVHNHYIPVADYLYCVYFLGFIVHTVTLRDIDISKEGQIFSGKKIL